MKVLILIVILFLNPAFSFAQDTALKEKAYDLLESLSGQITTLQSAENRARIGSNIAWSLWSHDEKRARAIFIAVGQDINLGLQPPDRNDPQSSITFLVFLQLRGDTIERISKYDPEFAYDFLKTTQPPYEQMPQRAWDKEREMTLRLGKAVAANNPDIALKLGRASLALAPSDDFLPLLRELLRKHREEGVTLYKETVDKVRKANIIQDYRMVNFARSLARLTPPLVDETGFRDLVGVLMTVAIANKCDQDSFQASAGYFCNELGPVLARLANFDPRAVRLKTFFREYEGTQAPDGRFWQDIYAEVEELSQVRDYVGLMRMGARYPPIKETVYWRAFDIALRDEDLERAQKTAEGYDDPEVKQRMLKRLEEAKNTAALSEAELDAIQRQVEELPDNRRRIDYMTKTAIRIGANNRTAVLKLLDRSIELIEMHKHPGEQIRAFANVAAFYCMEKSDRGLTIMESLMPKLNELVNAAIKLDGLDTNYVRSGEWNMSANGDLGSLLTNIAGDAPYFAWCDFDRAVNIAAQFERPEIRMMAQLKLAQAIVAGPPKRIRIY